MQIPMVRVRKLKSVPIYYVYGVSILIESTNSDIVCGQGILFTNAVFTALQGSSWISHQAIFIYLC